MVAIVTGIRVRLEALLAPPTMPISRPCASRSCQCAVGLARGAPAIDTGPTAGPAAAELIAMRPRTLGQQAQAVGGKADVQRRAFRKAHLVDAVAGDVDEQRLLLGASNCHRDVAEGAEKFDFGHLPMPSQSPSDSSPR